jgi:hypothetical protein
VKLPVFGRVISWLVASAGDSFRADAAQRHSRHACAAVFKLVIIIGLKGGVPGWERPIGGGFL